MAEATRKGPRVRILRAWRAERLLTIRDLARAAGVGVQTVNRIEAGTASPRAAVRQRIAAAIGVEPEQVAEFRRVILPPDDQETARRLERMGYPRRLAQRLGHRPAPRTHPDD